MLNIPFLIVCVDDEKHILDQLKGIIESMGYEQKAFLHPDLAIEFLHQNFKNTLIIISDLKMDNVSGLDFKENIKKNNDLNQIPFIILTGFWDKNLADSAMAKGVSGFLIKPIEHSTLVGKIDSLILDRKKMLLDEREMIQSFMDESDSLIEQIEQFILKLDENSEDKESLNAYFRLLHTIKGTASCVGLPKLAEFAHKYEDYISQIKAETLTINKKVVSVLLQGFDFLKNIIDQVKKTYSDQSFDIHQLITIFSSQQETVIEEKAPKEVASKISNPSSGSKTKDSEEKKEDEKISVSMNLLDSFMEESGELTVIRSSILKTIKKIEEKFPAQGEVEQLNDFLTAMYKVTSNIQNVISEMRKVPIATIFRPYKRLVRDLSLDLKKEVQLEMQGDDLMIDTNLAKVLSNVMIHLMRNAVDHGIEKPEKRLKLGKKSEGKIQLNASFKGESLIVDIRDDGGGIHKEIIKKKALEKGLYKKEELDSMNEQQIFFIIFDSGFSTASAVTDISGRGVGMDMVRSSVEAIGGEISIQSKEDEGSIFSLNLPLPKSVLIMNSLRVNISGRAFIFPVDQVKEVIIFQNATENDSVYQVEKGFVLKRMGVLYPLIDLAKIFNFSKKTNSDKAIILKSIDYQYAILVDEICDFEEVVIRAIPSFVTKKHFFTGASMLGSGEMALMVDVEQLAINENIHKKKSSLNSISPSPSINGEFSKDYLSFKSSGKTLFAIPLEKVYRLEKVLSKSIQYSGNQGLLRYRDNLAIPILDIDDLMGEVANMDEVKEWFDIIVVKSANKLVGIKVSKIMDIYSSSEALDERLRVKKGLLGTLFMANQLVSLLDVDYLEQFRSSAHLVA